MAFKEVNISNAYGNETRIRFDEVGDSVQGVLQEVVKIPKAEGGTFNKYVLKSGTEMKAFFGCYQLDQTLPNIPLGSLVQVTFQGEERIRGGKTMKNFKVMVDDATESKASA